MNKTDLINAVAEQADLTKKEAGSAVDAVFESIQNSLAKGEKVQLIGFGNFEVRERAARKGRNPQTGKEIDIPALFQPVPPVGAPRWAGRHRRLSRPAPPRGGHGAARCAILEPCPGQLPARGPGRGLRLGRTGR